MYDVAIIGGGPSGMTAAIYAARKQLDHLMICPDIGGQAVWASQVENYLGYSLISGVDLVMKFEEHVKEFGVPRVDSRVSKLERRDSTFLVKTDGMGEYESRTVIIASGRSARNIGVPGEEEYKGRGISYCVTCDAPFFAGKKVAVVGGGNAGLEAATQLIRIANQVYIIEVDPHLTGDPVLQKQIRAAGNTKIMTHSEITRVEGNRFVEGISVKDLDSGWESQVPVDGIFVEIGSMPNVDFVPAELRVNAQREIVIDCGNHTNIPGIFAAGDVTNIPGKQIIIAAGEGAKALLSAYDYIVRHFPERA